MNLKKEMKKIFIVSMTIATLLWTFSTRAYAIEKQNAAVEEQNDNSNDSQKEKQEKEYAKWKIKKVEDAYFYKKKWIRLLVDDTGKKTETNHFYYNKNGKVDIKIIRNKKDKIKKIKYISKKKAEKILDNYNTGYYTEEISDNYSTAYALDKNSK